MPKQRLPEALASFAVETRVSTPLYQQLYEHLKNAIILDQIPGGRRLPSTRSLASELGVARTTVQNAFEQLIAEGYIEGRLGSGTYVASSLPEGGFSPTRADLLPRHLNGIPLLFHRRHKPLLHLHTFIH